MKKTFLSLLTMLVCVFSFMAEAQTVPVCSLKAKFEFKTDKCFVKFADLSAAATGTTITNWFWDFGDASSSTLQNPTHTYAANGTYTVCLTIVGKSANGLQCKDQFCLPVTVQGCGQAEPCKLAAKFKFKTDGCKAGFVDLSVAAPGTTITNWYWDFGDATTSTLQNPIHSYATNGTYTVCLTIVGVNAAGIKCKDQFCLPVTIQGCGDPNPCGVKPLFKFKIEKCTVYFVDNTGTNPGTTITNWYWSFGDGGTSTLQNPTHTYAANGTYTVCLVVVGVNAAGQQCKNEYCYPVKIDGCGDPLPCGVKPLFDFKIDKCTVYFVDNSGTNPGTTITNWYWSFGDGGTSTLQNPTHTYAANGTYTVCLIVVGKTATGEQCKNEYCYQVKIEGCGNPDPCGVKPLFSYKIDKCIVYFTDLSGSNAGTTITNWYWSFGDGGTSTLQNPTHTYAANGTYSICLVVVGVNAAGQQCKNEYCYPVKIEGCGQVEPCKLAAKFDYKFEKCTGYFTDLSATGTGTTITNWFWEFGDGGTSTLQNPSHTYLASGVYTVCLTIVGTNANGEQCKDRYCIDVKVDCQGQSCNVGAKFDFKVDGCTVYFTDYSAAGAGTTITNWYWDFGDGNTSTVQNPTHVYATSGNYLVCLVIVGINPATGEQCKDRLCLEVPVKECEQGGCHVYPKFDFKVDSCTVYFTDYSAAGAGTTITNWYWDFGDGNTSTLQNPSHTYVAAGVYTVCLTVVGTTANGQQCKDRICVEIKVGECSHPQPCKLGAKFDFKIDKCAVYFTDYSAAGPGTTITNWYWDFGDGNTSTLQNPTHVYAAPGTYVVCLVIVGINPATGEQCKDKICLEVPVKECEQSGCHVYPKFDFKVDSCTVYFTDYSAAGAGTTITNWYWDFGDGNTSTLQNPSHTYAAAGIYKVCLTVVGTTANGQQCKEQLCIEIKVAECSHPQPCKVGAKFDFKVDKCTVYFADFSAAGAGTTITNWYWDFGDGNTSTLQNPVHTYAASGGYVVCLVVVGVNANGEQCKDKYCSDVKVEGCENTIPCGVFAKFTYKADKCNLYFTDLSAVTTGTIITSWFWDFGDGNTSTVQNPTHTYTTSGAYVVCLTITGVNADGLKCENRYCLTIKVDCGQTVPCNVTSKFDYKADKCTLYFTDYSTVATGTVITNWYWDFGDGNTSTLQNPSHTYASAGTYYVCLTIVGETAYGQQCKNTYCMNVIVESCDPGLPCKVSAKFDYKTSFFTVGFADLSTVGTGTVITNWYWDFGDGDVSTLQNPTHSYTSVGTFEVCLTVVGISANGQQCKDTYCTEVTVDFQRPALADVNKLLSLQVYPNPANDIVNIQFKLETAGQVNVTITDIQGRVLSVVQDGNMMEGYHKLNWNADVRSGMYFITIKTAKGVEQKQVVIQK